MVRDAQVAGVLEPPVAQVLAPVRVAPVRAPARVPVMLVADSNSKAAAVNPDPTDALVHNGASAHPDRDWLTTTADAGRSTALTG